MIWDEMIWYLICMRKLMTKSEIRWLYTFCTAWARIFVLIVCNTNFGNEIKQYQLYVMQQWNWRTPHSTWFLFSKQAANDVFTVQSATCYMFSAWMQYCRWHLQSNMVLSCFAIPIIIIYSFQKGTMINSKSLDLNHIYFISWYLNKTE